MSIRIKRFYERLEGYPITGRDIIPVRDIFNTIKDEGFNVIERENYTGDLMFNVDRRNEDGIEYGTSENYIRLLDEVLFRLISSDYKIELSLYFNYVDNRVTPKHLGDYDMIDIDMDMYTGRGFLTGVIGDIGKYWKLKDYYKAARYDLKNYQSIDIESVKVIIT